MVFSWQKDIRRSQSWEKTCYHRLRSGRDILFNEWDKITHLPRKLRKSTLAWKTHESAFLIVCVDLLRSQWCWKWQLLGVIGLACSNNIFPSTRLGSCSLKNYGTFYDFPNIGVRGGDEKWNEDGSRSRSRMKSEMKMPRYWDVKFLKKNCEPDKMQKHLTFLYQVFSNVSLNCLPKMMQSYIGCIVYL